MVVIGPALEVFLTAVGLVLLALAGLAFLTKPFWNRIATYFRRWYERDMRLEQQQREEAECRRKAQMEMREYCHDDILHPEIKLQSNADSSTTGAEESKLGVESSGQAAGSSVEEASVQQLGSERRTQ